MRKWIERRETATNHGIEQKIGATATDVTVAALTSNWRLEMPTPNKNEDKDHFVSRCIPIVIREGTAKDQKQAAAICFSIWRRSKKQASEEFLDELKRAMASSHYPPTLP